MVEKYRAPRDAAEMIFNIYKRKSQIHNIPGSFFSSRITQILRFFTSFVSSFFIELNPLEQSDSRRR